MKSYTVTANGIRQFVVEEGEGAPVILLHGFPETNYAWRYQIPVLSRHYRVIAPDLRGYGETDKPASGYDKRNMARDIRELMRALGLQKVVLVGHDRGARVATRFAKDYPELVDRLVVMDNVPTRIVARDLNASIARAYWFFLFSSCARPAGSADCRPREFLAAPFFLGLDLRSVYHQRRGV
ncbi:alpha/beta hydrolase [Enterobacter roggenkampii]|uniref:alpha/beta fold hydrolase n=1 Tax=Enterobacter roggenkampii TaxID=1812935 RepID=UPI001A906580|nr:alpha/beta hydrolase [Enterobacter roggenkampii]MBN9702272.1 alpha/beta hydrolase [Enterobacter roggenkampii]